MLHAFSRTEMLIGTEALEKLKKSTIAIFGVGGVGSYTVEALARSGIGKLVLIDYDEVCLTNINRQLHATYETIGKAKVELMKERIKVINPACEVTIFKAFYTPETAEEQLKAEYDYVVDAIDMVSSKLHLVERCKALGVPIISAMGAANKLDPTVLKVTDIYKTSMCPLAKVMRSELKKRGIKKLKVVYSTEQPLKPLHLEGSCPENCSCEGKGVAKVEKRQTPGSISFVPSVAGLIIAGEVIKDLIGYTTK
ncbi:tRNA cyclic N6-threonylcarbamoyladenosine(37) synthase TcdA [Sporanaerobium hydrogeniformans]|uniref:tRNA cyclic N6-threonylcarbamoyladenosine(37) synthase TcdA n=1 Tax=Sporanaerobium hydrogeniformans TaxID=3072179 RepID=A0AC61DG61_9FIRM|nr:tRNA threonylcarbamoyladenosine dehydratase [Sporanaerobium hydrogeniformans]PHV71646.1 tRNA cyclic N6-threonylcarbamoyladenosine(37) synthase TcdA [Sporanaerobium hydrogeniformans]